MFKFVLYSPRRVWRCLPKSRVNIRAYSVGLVRATDVVHIQKHAQGIQKTHLLDHISVPGEENCPYNVPQ